MGWGKAQVSVKSLKIFDNGRGLSKLSNHYLKIFDNGRGLSKLSNHYMIKNFASWYAMINKLGTK